MIIASRFVEPENNLHSSTIKRTTELLLSRQLW